ncbi:MAG: hypothetical protein LBF37_00405, partial [Rickettsiales bacterium]|nr:hypothetical protein [Rickettsiales bacterium]
MGSRDAAGNLIYTREERVTAQVSKILNTLKLPDELLGQMGDYLKKTKSAEADFHARQLKEFQ